MGGAKTVGFGGKCQGEEAAGGGFWVAAIAGGGYWVAGATFSGRVGLAGSGSDACT